MGVVKIGQEMGEEIGGFFASHGHAAARLVEIISEGLFGEDGVARNSLEKIFGSKDDFSSKEIFDDNDNLVSRDNFNGEAFSPSFTGLSDGGLQGSGTYQSWLDGLSRDEIQESAIRVVASEIAEEFGMATPGIVDTPLAPNMEMFSVSNGILRYNEDFVIELSDSTGADAVIGVIAHEMGHKLTDEIIGNQNLTNWQQELCADTIAGVSLARAGMDPEGLEEFFRTQCGEGSDSHPHAQLRIEYLMKGYEWGLEHKEVDFQVHTLREFFDTTVLPQTSDYSYEAYLQNDMNDLNDFLNQFNNLNNLNDSNNSNDLNSLYDNKLDTLTNAFQTNIEMPQPVTASETFNYTSFDEVNTSIPLNWDQYGNVSEVLHVLDTNDDGVADTLIYAQDQNLDGFQEAMSVVMDSNANGVLDEGDTLFIGDGNGMSQTDI